MEIGDRFKEICRHFGLNGNSLAKRIGVPYTSVRNVLEGTSKPGYELMKKVISEFKEVNARWFLTGVGPMLEGDQDLSLLTEPMDPYGKSVQDVIKEKDERIEELKALVRLLEEKVGR